MTNFVFFCRLQEHAFQIFPPDWVISIWMRRLHKITIYDIYVSISLYIKVAAPLRDLPQLNAFASRISLATCPSSSCGEKQSERMEQCSDHDHWLKWHWIWTVMNASKFFLFLEHVIWVILNLQASAIVCTTKMVPVPVGNPSPEKHMSRHSEGFCFLL